MYFFLAIHDLTISRLFRTHAKRGGAKTDTILFATFVSGQGNDEMHGAGIGRDEEGRKCKTQKSSANERRIGRNWEQTKRKVEETEENGMAVSLGVAHENNKMANNNERVLDFSLFSVFWNYFTFILSFAELAVVTNFATLSLAFQLF